MLFLRVLGKALLFIAFAAAAYDGARSIAVPNQGLLLTSLQAYLSTYFPGSGGDLERFFQANGPAYVWTGLVQPLLNLPLCVLCAALGALIFLAGYRSPPPEIAGDLS
jgi:hypothetical protein